MALTQVETSGLSGSGTSSNSTTGNVFSQTGPFKNRIINGDMRIDQRNAGASVTPTDGSYSLDRWQAFLTQSSKFTLQQNAGSVTRPAGFTNYLGATSSSAYSVLASDIFAIGQQIEGFNTADFDWGTANAKTVTLSFWVRSSLTGTFGGSLTNNAQNRFYAFSYSISAANTWEYKTLTITGDTSGTWATDNSAGIRVRWGLGVGSNNSGTAGSWGGSSLWSATGATSVVGTNGATFYITGVQLEAGSVATPFERRSYGQELSLCQRYARKITNATVSTFSTTTTVYSNNSWPMRTLPTSTLVTNGQLTGNGGNNNVTGISAPAGDGDGFYFDVNSTGLTATASYNLRGTLIILSAEL